MSENDRPSQGGDIGSTVTINQTPGAPNGKRSFPALPGQQVRVHADPLREYVASGTWQWYANLPRALPWSIDLITRDLGDDIYDKMLTDAGIQAAVATLKTGILQEGVQITSAVKRKSDDGYQDAATLADVVTRMFDDLEPGLDDVLWDILNALCFGNKVAEKVFSLETTYTGKQQLVLHSLKVKPRESVAFVVDSQMNILGYLALIPGLAYPVQVGTIIANLPDLPNLLPIEKVALLNWRVKDHDPRGTSALRAAYDPWNQQIQLIPEFLRYLAQFASPSLIGFTPDGAESEPARDAAGNVLLDAVTQEPVMVNPQQSMLNALLSFRNGSATVFPYSAQVKEIAMSGNGDQFFKSFDLLEKRKRLAILNEDDAPSISMPAGGPATAPKPRTVLDSIIAHGKRGLLRMLRRQVVRDFVRYNYPDRFLPLLPVITLGKPAATDFAARGAVISQLTQSGYLSPSQFPGVDNDLNLPERTDEDMATLKKAHQNAAMAPVKGAMGRGMSGAKAPSPAPANVGKAGNKGAARGAGAASAPAGGK